MTDEFAEPRLVAIYETVNAYDAGTQPEFYPGLAAEIDAATIVDVGCGTGLITRDLARRGYHVVGIDPSGPMLDVARRGDGGDRVHWICGDVSQLGVLGADLAIMSGHVAQFFLTDESWKAALAALQRTLRPGGMLSFEAKNPQAREWERWKRSSSTFVDDPSAGRIETWSEFQDLTDGVVTYANHYLFAATGEEIVTAGQLRFRSRDELTQSLADAGFAIDRVYGDWDRRPAGPKGRELIVVAVRLEVDT